MKLNASKVYLASGKKIINGYRITLAKTEVEKAGFKAGDELKATFKNGKITITKKEA